MMGILKIKKLPVNRYIDIAVFLALALFPLLVTEFRVDQMSRVLVYVIFALSIDLLWGFTGLMSFGHAVLFGAGGYVVALSYTLIKGLPWHMQGAGYTQIPAVLTPLLSPVLAFLLALAVPGLIAWILGIFIFSSKVKGVFFSLITLALAQIFQTFLDGQQVFLNGSSGLGGLPRSILGSSAIPRMEFYYILLGVVLLVYLFCLWLINSRFGAVLQSIRENEPRLTFLGFRPNRFKTAVYVISGMLAGLAGVLYIPTVRIITPLEVGVTLSTLLLVWVAVGGRGNLTGAIVGTIFVNWAGFLLSERISDYWLLVLGGVVLLLVFFIPSGIIGKLIEMQYARQHSKRQNAALQQEVSL